MGPLLVLAALSACVDCTPYDPGGGVFACDPAEYCEVGGGPEAFIRADDGREYNCIANGSACYQLLCEQCDLDGYTRQALCPGGA